MAEVDNLRAVYTHHRCASSWIGDFIGFVCRFCGWRLSSFDRPDQFRHNLTGFLAENNIEFLYFRNANRKYIDDIPEHRAFHIIRDPRDILVSGYFSHRNSHSTEGWPELIAHRQTLQQLSFEDGILAEFEFSSGNFQDIATWDYDRSDILELRFEDLIENPYALLLNAFGFIDALSSKEARSRDWLFYRFENFWRRVAFHLTFLPALRIGIHRVPAEILLLEVYRNRFEKITGGRAPGTEDKRSHNRKGVAGDWVEYFTPRIVDEFKNRYGSMLIQLGYESDENW